MMDALCGNLGPCFDGSINSARHRGCGSHRAPEFPLVNASN